jgi:hypothetical protein
MKTDPALLATLMQLPEAERLEIAMTVLDQSSPAGMTTDDIVATAVAREDELESGAVTDLSYDELASGLRNRPRPTRE